MSEMIERVAHALFTEKYRPPEWPTWESRPEEIKRIWRRAARASIEAMRDLTPEMADAYKGALTPYIESLPTAERAKGGRYGYRVKEGKKLRLRWNAMIDAALADAP